VEGNELFNASLNACGLLRGGNDEYKFEAAIIWWNL
jgi:hypothetical protein